MGRRSYGKAYKKDYTELFDKPDALFTGLQTRLWPCGSSDIQIEYRNGERFASVRITATRSKDGILLSVSPMYGARDRNMLLVEKFDPQSKIGAGGKDLVRVAARNAMVRLHVLSECDYSRDYMEWWDRDPETRGDKPERKVYDALGRFPLTIGDDEDEHSN